MPFAITCPACRNVFRTKTEREIGKGVQCAKCGEQFFVSAENQKARFELLDESEPPAKHRNAKSRSVREPVPDEDGWDPDKPTPKPSRRKTILIVGAAVMLVLIASAGTGAYLLFMQNGESAGDRIQPKRELPMEVFAYRPSDRASIDFHNLSLMREKKWEAVYLPPFLTTLPPGQKISYDQVESLCHMSDIHDKTLPNVVVVTFLEPMDIAPVAANSQMAPMPGKRPGVYATPDKPPFWICFQPDPKRIVFAGSNFEMKYDRDRVAKVAEQNMENTPLPAEIRDGLTELSGYGRIEVRVPTAPGAAFHFSGKFKEASGFREHYVIDRYGSPEEAKKQYESLKEIEATMPKHGKSTERFEWVRGNRKHWFQRDLIGKGR